MTTLSKKAKKLAARMDLEYRKRSTPRSILGGTTILQGLLQRDNAAFSEKKMLEEFHTNPVFYAGINLTASQIASTDLWTEVNGTVDRRHPVYEQLKNPSTFHSKYTFLWLVTAYLLVTGVSYIYIDEAGSLIPVPPPRVSHFGGNRYQAQIWTGKTVDARLHHNFVKLTLPDLREPCLSGSGYGSSLGSELDISSAAREMEKSTLENNARPDAIVNLQGLNQSQLKATKESWEKSHSGPGNAGKIAWGSAQKLDVKTLQTSFKDLAFIDLRQHSADHIRRNLGIPPELLGKSDNSNRASIEAAFYVYAKTVLNPRLTQIIDGLNKHLIPIITDDPNVSLAAEDVVPEDKAFKKEIIKSHPAAFTVNELRKIAGFSEVVDGDRPLQGSLDLSAAENDQEKSADSQSQQSSFYTRVYGQKRSAIEDAADFSDITNQLFSEETT